MTDAPAAEPPDGAELPAQRSPRAWAMLAYIAGDNDLSEAGIRDIEEMCQIGTSANVFAAVEIDTEGDWEGSIRYEISEPQWDGHSYRMVIERLPERDSGDPGTLQDFARWAGERYPAQHRLLTVWGHGAGFLRGGIASDDGGRSMTIPRLARALRRAQLELGRLSILGFDACTMAMVEIAHELSDLSDLLVGSQALVPNAGWRYDWVLYDMLAVPQPRELAKSIVDRFVEEHRGGPSAATQSVVDLTQVARAHAQLHELGLLLTRRVSERRSMILLARDCAQSYESAPDYVDIVDFCQNLARALDEREILEATERVMGAVREAVVHSAHTHPEVERSHGLSMWFPRSPYEYFAHRGDYVTLRGCGPEQGWVRWLDALHG